MGAEILETLRTLGVTVEVIAPDRLRFQPASRIPSDLIPLIRESKPEILKALRSRPAIAPKPGKPIACRYDWIPGYRGLRLHCVAHRHEAGVATVFRMVCFGRDVLFEMAEKGILTGQARDDAARVS